MARRFIYGFVIMLAGGIACLLLTPGCRQEQGLIPRNDKLAFSQYWFQGKAEISSYTLHQARYGAQHEGKAVLVFVTEDFSKSKQVKLDEPGMHSSDAVPVMKLNFLKAFVTGMYDYHMMYSLFTPLDARQYPHSLKLTSSSQDWCGQGFMQYNWKGNRYDVQHFSYFGEEGDTQFSIAGGVLEDEIWTRIRTAPELLPTGTVKFIPSAFYLQLKRITHKMYEATTSLTQNGTSYTYSINYAELKRTLSIEFESTFPHCILSWKEDGGEGDITTGTLIHTTLSDYWQHQQPADDSLRLPLHLEK